MENHISSDVANISNERYNCLNQYLNWFPDTIIILGENYFICTKGWFIVVIEFKYKLIISYSIRGSIGNFIRINGVNGMPAQNVF